MIGAILCPTTGETTGRFALTAAQQRLAQALGWPIQRLPVGDDNRYETALKAWWDHPDDLVVWEHDLELPLGALEALAACPHPACAWEYGIYHPAGHARRWAAWGDLVLQSETRDPRMGPVLAAVRRQRRLWEPPPGTAAGWWTSAHRVVDTAGQERWARPGQRWADLVGFGCTKLGTAIRHQRPAWEPGPWWNLDSRVSAWLYGQGVRWHLHGPPARHHHHCLCHREEGVHD